MIKLDIGGGLQKRDDDFISVDILNGDVIADMGFLPFKDNSIDFIWSAHTLEHSGIYKAGNVLKEWARVLKPGAKIIIQVPDMDYVAKYWLTGPDRKWAEEMLFGMQIDDGEFHKCAFTASTLRADCEGVGLEVQRVEMRWTHTQETLQAVCRKPIREKELK
jgi:predicted SAM-dependent methyltransferase